ncbi:DUF1028 domain-containing protein [bacterium]|nr:DUF1028 domain-containing protein [bacterium]
MVRFKVTFLALLLLAGLFTVARAEQPTENISTFSIVAYDPETGELGVAVQSKFFAVGSVVPFAEAEVGAIASQAFGNTTFGPRGLRLLKEGMSVHETLDLLLASDQQREHRQVGIVDAEGHSATYTGKECMEWAGGRAGKNYAVQGNILTGEEVVVAMEKAYLDSKGELLGERLLRAIEAGQAAGGDSRGMQSAAIYIVKKGAGYGGYNDVYCDLRVDDHEEPIKELRRIFHIWKYNALIMEGYRLADEKEFDRAFDMGDEMIALQPKNPEGYYHYGCFLSKAGKKSGALELLGKAIALDERYGPRAAQDPDYEWLYNDPEFKKLVGTE